MTYWCRQYCLPCRKWLWSRRRIGKRDLGTPCCGHSSHIGRWMCNCRSTASLEYNIYNTDTCNILCGICFFFLISTVFISTICTDMRYSYQEIQPGATRHGPLIRRPKQKRNDMQKITHHIYLIFLLYIILDDVCGDDAAKAQLFVSRWKF